MATLLEFMNDAEQLVDPFVPGRSEVLAAARSADLLPEEVEALESGDSEKISRAIAARDSSLIVGVHLQVHAPEEEEEEEEPEEEDAP
jgi:hypothetical protein